MSKQDVSRRSFVKGAGAAAVGGAIAAAPALADGAKTVSFSFVDTVQWDEEYDVVVVGYGGAIAAT